MRLASVLSALRGYAGRGAESLARGARAAVLASSIVVGRVAETVRGSISSRVTEQRALLDIARSRKMPRGGARTSPAPSRQNVLYRFGFRDERTGRTIYRMVSYTVSAEMSRAEIQAIGGQLARRYAAFSEGFARADLTPVFVEIARITR